MSLYRAFVAACATYDSLNLSLLHYVTMHYLVDMSISSLQLCHYRLLFVHAIYDSKPLQFL